MDSLENIINSHAKAMSQEAPEIEYPVVEEPKVEEKSAEEKALEALVSDVDYGDAEAEDAARFQAGVDEYNKSRQEKIAEDAERTAALKKVEVMFEDLSSEEHIEKGFMHQSKLMDLHTKFVQEELKSRGKHMELPDDVIISPETGLETHRLAYIDAKLSMIITDARDDDEIRAKVKELVDEYWVEIKDTPKSDPTETVEDEEEEVEQPTEETPKDDSNTINVNIEAPSDSNVEVKIDKDLVGELTREKVIKVKVTEVSEKELLTKKKFKPFDRNKIKPASLSANGVTVTLPGSCYRCTIEPMQYFEYVKALATVKEEADQASAFYSLIYKHMKNVSIGEFSSFEEFLRTTKMTDLSLLLWALAAATMGHDERINIFCRNADCMIPAEKDEDGNIKTEAIPRSHLVEYDPRNLIHIDLSKLPSYYPEIEAARAGGEAKAVYEKYSDMNEQHQLPDSNISFMIHVPSFFDDMYKVGELEAQLRNKYHLAINEPMPLDAQLDFQICQFLDCFIIEEEDGSLTKVDDFDDIIYVYSECLNADQQIVLSKVINEYDTRVKNSPMDFYLENIKCPYCGRVTKRIPLQPIGQEMLFRLTRKFENQKIEFSQQHTN